MSQFGFRTIVLVVFLLVPHGFSAEAQFSKIGSSEKEVKSTCAKIKRTLQLDLDNIAKRPESEATFANTVVAMEAALGNLNNAADPVNFMKYVSTEAGARKAADFCESSLSQLLVDVFGREDLYKRMKQAALGAGDLNEIDKTLLDDYITAFRRNGLELPKKQRELFLKNQKAIVKNASDFESNLINWVAYVEASKEELTGVPEALVSSLTKLPNGKLKITMSYPHVFGVLDNGSNEDLRKRVQTAFLNRGGKKNVDLLEKTIALRDQNAKLLGFANHAAYVLDEKMAKTPEKVLTFLNSLQDGLKEVGKKELKVLQALKQKETGDSKATFHAWDYRYYDNLLKKQSYQVDTEKIREYFVLPIVLDGMFKIYQTLLGVTFNDISDKLKPWHSSVKSYSVTDNTTKQVVSYFFMDLFPRENKYNHAAAFTLISGRELPDGTYQLPVSSIVANFNAPTKDNPALLSHDEVETLFHEFGHIAHQTLTKAKYYSHSGTKVKRDFVEAPSQMLENWVWNKETVSLLSGHYKDFNKRLPEDMLSKMIAAKKVNQGLFYLRQLQFGLLDMTYHTSANVDSTSVYEQLQKEVFMIPMTKGTIPQASFGHLMGGYDAGYYGYLWSEVFAADMFTRFAKEGLLSKKAGTDYREYILAPGGSIDPDVLLKRFLGREPNQKAFLRELGLAK